MSNTNYVHIHSECAKCGGCIYECEHKVKTVLTTTSSKEEYVIMTDRPTPASDETRLKLIATILKDCNVSTIKALQKSDIEAGTQSVLTATKAIDELITAAVQAESRKLLEKALAVAPPEWPIPERRDYMTQRQEGYTEAIAEYKANITALLDSEQQKLGGNS